MANTAFDSERHARRRDECRSRFVFNVFYWRWHIILAAALVGALMLGIGGFIRYERRITYVASTQLCAQPSMREMVPLNSGGYRAASSINPNPYGIAADIVNILVGQGMTTGEKWSALATPEEYQAAADDIAASLDIEADDKTNEVSITCTRNNKRDAARIAEAAARALIRNHRQTRLEQERDTLASVQVQLDETQREMLTLETHTAAIETQLRERRADVPESDAVNAESQRLARAAEKLRTRFDKLLDFELALRTSMDGADGEVTRQTPVRTRSVRTQNINLAATVAIGGFFGLLVGLVMAILIEINDTSLKSIEDVAEYTGLDVIGAIPRVRSGGKRGRAYAPEDVDEDEKKDAAIVTLFDPESPASEAYRALPTRFALATIQQKPRTVLVTSAVPGEGKTTTAVNMAVTFADNGMRVLLVDADMRRPDVHQVLRMEQGPGLAELLRENLDPHAIVRPTRIENLWMASSGRVPPNPAEVLGSDKMRRLMRDLGKEFDLVLCDAPSILAVTDPVLLAKDVDAVVLVIAAQYARRETIARAKSLLETANANIAGAVLNGLAARRRSAVPGT